jgi:signal peptidase I
MSLPAEGLDPASADPTPDLEERAERAARADAAAIAARAARASLTASTAGASDAVLDRELAPAFDPAFDPALDPSLAPGLDAQAAIEPATRPYGRLTLTGGILGRMTLAFVTGCLVVTLLPLLFGWRPYVVKSGSMEPRIGVGDVILASPDRDPKSLLGHVTVFDDPGQPGSVKSHRVIAINPDGTLTTKGDANPTADPQTVRVTQVHGIGRLLVRWAGLPLIWLRTGQYLFLGLFLLVIGAAAWAVARDSEDDDQDDDRAEGDAELTDHAAAPAFPTRAERRRDAVLERRAQRRRTITMRLVATAAGAGLLVVPSASAAFSATTKTTGSTWTVPSYSYPTTVASFATPYLYWQLGDTGATAADASGNGRTGTYAGTYTRSVTGGTPDTSPNKAVTATTTTACVNTTSTTAISGPTVFTEIIWFKTTAGYTGGGKLIGFETPRTGVAVAGSGGNYDRHIYLDGAGKVWFGVYNGGNQTIGTAAAYNDGNWHMAAATLSSAGMALYVDGVLRGTNSNATAETSTGWWRVGCGNLAGWGTDWTGANNPGTTSTTAANVPFVGSLDEATVYSGTALTAANVAYLYWTR